MGNTNEEKANEVVAIPEETEGSIHSEAASDQNTMSTAEKLKKLTDIMLGRMIRFTHLIKAQLDEVVCIIF